MTFIDAKDAQKPISTHTVQRNTTAPRFRLPFRCSQAKEGRILRFHPQTYHNPHEACTMRTVLIPHMEELLQKITDLQSAVNTGKDSL